MKNIDEDLRQTYQSYVSGKSPDSRIGCPTPEMLLDSFDPKTSREVKDGVVDHISRCSSCAREFELIREAMSHAEDLARSFDEIRAKRKVSRPGRPPVRSMFRYAWAYTFASLILISAGAVYFIVRNDRARMEGRGGPHDASRSVQPTGPVNGAIPLVFKWEPGDGVEYYKVEISDESLLPVWQSPRIFAPFLTLPFAVQARLERGRNYYWSVLAFDKVGNRTESGIRTFLLRSPDYPDQ